VESVLGGLEPFAWDDETAAKFEITIELLNRVVGHYAGLLGTARPDTPGETLAQWREAWKAAVGTRNELRADDADAIAAAHRDAVEALAEVHGQ
jgi:hypothetical protein